MYDVAYINKYVKFADVFSLFCLFTYFYVIYITNAIFFYGNMPCLLNYVFYVSVTMVLGIPTVKRDVQSYLMSTLQNLIENMSPEEKMDAVIIVFIAEVSVIYS